MDCCFTGIYPELRERLLQRAQAVVMEDLQREDNAGRMVGIYDRERKEREVTEEECGLLCEQKGEQKIKKVRNKQIE